MLALQFDVATEQSPPGGWNVYQVTHEIDYSGSLEHSRVYCDPDVIRRVVEWLRNSVTESESNTT